LVDPAAVDDIATSLSTHDPRVVGEVAAGEGVALA
jgi:hypothetical protein